MPQENVSQLEQAVEEVSLPNSEDINTPTTSHTSSDSSPGVAQKFVAKKSMGGKRKRSSKKKPPSEASSEAPSEASREASSEAPSEASSEALYDDKGIHIATGLDLCDCLDDKCEGCFYPCPECESQKCGHECRQGRDWMIEYHFIQGKDMVIKNKYLNQ